MARPKVIVFAGISGLQKRAVLKRLQEYIGKKRSISSKIDKKIPILSPEGKPYIDIPLFLENFSAQDLATAWHEQTNNFLKEFRKTISGKPKPIAILLPLHFTFDANGLILSPFSWPHPQLTKQSLLKTFIEKLKPDLVVNLIDDIHTVQRVLKSEEPAKQLDLSQIIRWRDFETIAADYIAITCAKTTSGLCGMSPIVSVRCSQQMLYRLIFERECCRLYASYPISIARRRTKRGHKYSAELNSFRKLMDKQYILFDPLAIDEKPLELAYNAALKRGRGKRSKRKRRIWIPEVIRVRRWPLTLKNCISNIGTPKNWTYSLSTSDLATLARKIGSTSKSTISLSISSRDFRLIDQSEVVVVYRPTYNHRLTWSGGTLAERAYAVGNKRVIIVKDKKNDGPLEREDGTLESFVRNAIVIDSFGDLQLLKNRKKVIGAIKRNIDAIMAP